MNGKVKLEAYVDRGVFEKFREFVFRKHKKLYGFFSVEVENALLFYMGEQQPAPAQSWGALKPIRAEPEGSPESQLEPDAGGVNLPEEEALRRAEECLRELAAGCLKKGSGFFTPLDFYRLYCRKYGGTEGYDVLDLAVKHGLAGYSEEKMKDSEQTYTVCRLSSLRRDLLGEAEKP